MPISMKTKRFVNYNCSNKLKIYNFTIFKETRKLHFVPEFIVYLFFSFFDRRNFKLKNWSLNPFFLYRLTIAIEKCTYCRNKKSICAIDRNRAVPSSILLPTIKERKMKKKEREKKILAALFVELLDEWVVKSQLFFSRILQ